MFDLREEQDERKDLNATEKLIDDFINYEEKYEIKREFISQSWVLQHIRNPIMRGELITVQKCNIKDSFAASNLSVNEMLENDLVPENMIVHYETQSKQEYLLQDPS